MTEAEWLACERSCPMLESVWGKFSERKYRLFACACCYRIWDLLPDPRSRRAVRLAERIAEGEQGLDKMVSAAWQEAAQVAWAQWRDPNPFAAEAAVCSIDGMSFIHPPLSTQYRILFSAQATAARAVAGLRSKQPEEKDSEHLAQANLVRDIFGNPFRAVHVEKTWQTANVVDLARGFYDEWDFDHLPILADALEEAGCENANILNHCRQPGEHVRGCWVVDLVLGKS